MLVPVIVLTFLVAAGRLTERYYESETGNSTRMYEMTGAGTLEEVLKPYKGGLLYVYHSSVNCAPCYKEMQSRAGALHARYEGKPLTFVYLCSESNFPLKKVSNGILWRKKLSQIDPGGIHYLISKELSLDIFRNTVDSLSGEMPYYPWQFIVDERGEIINRHARRPSDSLQLYQQLDSLLATRK